MTRAARRLTALALFTLLTGESTAQGIKLSGPLARPRAGDVSDYVLSTDGTRVVYRADQTTDEVFELFSAPLDGSTPPIRLNPPLPPGGDVNPGVRAASGRILYLADQATDDAFELYSVPANGGGGAIRLSGDLVAGGDVSSFWVGSNEQYAVYLADEHVNNVLHLFRVPVDGSAPAIDLTPGQSLSGYYGPRAWLSPDGSVAVFTTSDPSSEYLRAVPTDGSGAPVLLDVTTSACFCVAYFDDLEFSSDSNRIVYGDYVDHDGPLDVDLYSVPVDGSQAAVKLNPQTLDGYFLNFEYDGLEHVVFRVGVADLFSVRTDGTGLVQLNPPGWQLPNPGFGSSAAFAADTANVVFQAANAGQKAIFRAAPDGSGNLLALVPPTQNLSLCQLEILGSNVFLSGQLNSLSGLIAIPLPDGGATNVLTFLLGCAGALSLTPDAQELLFTGPRDEDGMYELYAAPVDGSQPARQLSAPLVSAGDVRSILITPGGHRVVYAADQELDETIELYGARLDASEPPFKYNPALAGGLPFGDVLAFQLSPGGSRVVYRADADVDEVFDLYAVMTSGRGSAKRLTESLGGSGQALDFVFAPSGHEVVFEYQTARFKLYSVPTSLGHPPVELDSSNSAFDAPLTVTPDGARVVYRKAAGSDHSLYSVPLDGSAPAVTLASPPGTQSVTEFQVAPLGDTVVYRADQDAFLVVELYRVPSDGSAPAQKLNPPLVGGGDVGAFVISPDATRVVYRADQDADAVDELFSVPSDASAPAVKLNGALVSAGDVRDFAISPDSLRAVYRADETVDGQVELYSALADGSGTALRLTVLSAGRTVQPDFQISPDSQQVFYRSNALAAAVVQLFVVPIDGSASPLKLNDTLVTGGNVTAFAVSPDQSRVVYLADQTQNDVFELFSVPSDGSGPVLALDPLPPFADVTAFHIDPDSLRVIYAADRNADGVVELFAAALDGSSPAERLNGTLPAGADVETDFVPLVGGGVVYRADQDTNDVLELYHFLDLDLDKHLQSPSPTRSVTVLH